MTNPMVPTVFNVIERRQESGDVVTLRLAPQSGSTRCTFAPGQFNMLYAFGLGESAISISGSCDNQESFVHTIRAVGNVTNSLCDLKSGDTIGVRGPFGTAWPVELAFGKTLLIVAGGIGLAPLRPALYFAAAHRDKFERVILLVGARTPGDLLFKDELERWKSDSAFEVETTVDVADVGWDGNVGVVPKLLGRVDFEASSTIAMMCGPEIMMRFTAADLFARGIAKRDVYVSMERNMRCAIGHCGHCQYGPLFICKDGPVFSFDRIEPFFLKREL